MIGQMNLVRALKARQRKERLHAQLQYVSRRGATDESLPSICTEALTTTLLVDGAQLCLWTTMGVALSSCMQER